MRTVRLVRASVRRALVCAIGGIVIGSCTDSFGPVTISAPTNVTVTLVSPNSARISWTASAESGQVTNYNVIRSGTKVGESTSTTYVDTGLSETVTYIYTVSANGIGGVVSSESATGPASTITIPDVTAPTVTSTSPAAGSSGVATAATVTATFSEPMDAATIAASTFTLKTSAGAPVAGSVTYVAATRLAEFRPTAPLASVTAYAATITTGVKDVAGNRLAADFNLVFTTRDEVPPVVSSVVPASGATGVATGVVVAATFSKAMDASTITGASVTLRQTSSGSAVAGAVTYNIGTRTVSFAPSASLLSATAYTLTIANTVRDAAGNALAGAFNSSFTTGGVVDTTPPAVLTTAPLDGATGVPLATVVMVTFSEAMTGSTVNSLTFSMKVAATGASVAGNVAYHTASNSATFTPSAPLTNSTAYTATLTTGLQDLAGNALLANYVFSFTTVVAGTPPTITANTPANGAASVPVNAAVSVTFSKDMEAQTLNATTFSLRLSSSGASVSGSVSYNPATRVAQFTPNGGLLANGFAYTVTVSTGVQDATGLPLGSDFIFTFTTVADATPPAVGSTSPADGATGVSVGTTVTATFTRAMELATVNTSTFILRTSGGASVAGSVVYSTGSNTATFMPSAPLAAGVTYTGTVTTGAKSTTGIPLASDYMFSFTTAAAPPPPGQNISGQPYFQGTDVGDRIHFHIRFTQSGQNVGLPGDCQPLPLADCEIFPLNQAGADAIGPPSPNQNGGSIITAITGTFTDPGITFTFTIANGRTFTFTGTVSNSNKMTGTISGATLSPSSTLILDR